LVCIIIHLKVLGFLTNSELGFPFIFTPHGSDHIYINVKAAWKVNRGGIHSVPFSIPEPPSVLIFASFVQPRSTEREILWAEKKFHTA
jgi:hypothetical protein